MIGDQMTRRPDDQMTRRSDEQITRWPDDQMTICPYWPDDHVDQMTMLTIWTFWPYDQMTRWPCDHMTRWPKDQMTRWPDDHIDHIDQMTILAKWPDDRITSFTTHQNASPEPQKLAGHLPYQIEWWHMTIMLYRNINKNNSNPLPLKASPEPQ